jgi:NAD(P)-dependent dehydrogenase (short-subunit alcohol dehydrogenase family)
MLAASLEFGRSRHNQRKSAEAEGEDHDEMGKIMMELAGKTAFVTGGASGIGLALGQALAQVGMNVMLADIETTALTAAASGLSGQGLTNVCSVTCDVADPVSVEEAAETTYKTFGAVHVVCNNAGVAAGGGIDDISVETWRWVLDVNLMGVLHGVRTFLPHIRGHRQGGHIVNTASMAGMNSGLGFSPYSASKFAVVNMSEGLAMQLAPLDIGVTVLLPWFRADPHPGKRPQSTRALWSKTSTVTWQSCHRTCRHPR